MNEFVVSDPSDSPSRELALEAAGMGIWEWDFERGELLTDDRTAVLLGIDQDAAGSLLDSIHPDDLIAVQAVMQASLETGERFAVEYRVMRPDGSTSWVQTHGRTFFDDHHRAVRTIGVGVDTTDLRIASTKDAERQRDQMVVTVGRAQQLQTIMAALGEAMTLDHVVEVMLQQTKDLLGTLFAGLVVFGEDVRSIRLVRLDQLPDGVVERWVEAGQQGSSPLGDAIAGRRALFHGSRQAHTEDYPHLHDVAETIGSEASASLPLVAAGRVIGALAMAWAEEHTFDAEERTFLLTLARQCGEAIQRAMLFEQQHRVATILQRAILPEELPNLGDLGFAARYLPAEKGVEVGGDWYDAFACPDGSVWLSVGDVGGHGVPAASVMSQLRNAVRACAFAGLDPSRSMEVLNRLLVSSSPDVYATAVVISYDPGEGTLRWSNAGHPPPILAAPGALAVVLDAVHGSLLGLHSDARFPTSEAEFPPGGLLVLYTDGLIERRGSDLQNSLTSLAGMIGRLPLSRDIQALCDRVLASAFRGHDRQDDLCLLLAQRSI
jgi:serine phosphatase RsbU (regulator of sigma subunit)